MNPAIVAPDAFDIVAFGVDKGLTSDQVIGDFSGLTGRKRLLILPLLYLDLPSKEEQLTGYLT